MPIVGVHLLGGLQVGENPLLQFGRLEVDAPSDANAPDLGPDVAPEVVHGHGQARGGVIDAEQGQGHARSLRALELSATWERGFNRGYQYGVWIGLTPFVGLLVGLLAWLAFR